MGIFKRRGPSDDTADADEFALDAEVEVAFAVRAAGGGKGEIYWGAPSRCPECRVYGFVEDVDHASGVTTNRCLSNDCQTRWVISKRALREMRRRLAAGVGPVRTPTGSGVEGSVPIPDDSPLFHAHDGPGPTLSGRAAAASRDPLDRFTEALPDPPRIDRDARPGESESDADAAGDAARRRRFGRDRIA